MSRSRKKNPIRGITTCRSEKSDKIILHRKMRRKTKQVLFNYDIEEDKYNLPDRRKVMDIWSMGKDGKIICNPPKHPINCENCIYQLQCLVGGERQWCDAKYDEKWYKQAIRK